MDKVVVEKDIAFLLRQVLGDVLELRAIKRNEVQGVIELDDRRIISGKIEAEIAGSFFNFGVSPEDFYVS